LRFDKLLYIERARLYAAGASHDRERLMGLTPWLASAVEAAWKGSS
jgi:hypothetical protein